MNFEHIIIGTGLIAKSLMGIDFGRPTLVLASGVSDSQEIRDEAFQREADLVEQTIARHARMHAVYCSTCSIDSGVVTPYTTHKMNMEQLVMKAAVSCHVFRLPQVVGLVHNRTLVSHFVDSILQDQILKIQIRATRNLLDVRDFARVAALLVRRNAGAGEPQNIASCAQVPVIEIVAEIARLLHRPVRTELQDSGYSQLIDTSFLRGQLQADDPLFDRGHWRVVLQHYVPLMAREVSL
jgi:nucleoside-diphosphate-sugar epimerase